MTKLRSIGTKVGNGTELTRLNALKHGILSRYVVLPWEDPGEYAGLVAALASEHEPQGPTEEHLVEELAGILWRKRRLRQAEGAAHSQGLRSAIEPFGHTAEAAVAHLSAKIEGNQVAEAVRSTEAETDVFLADIEEDEAQSRRALEFAENGDPDAYDEALSALRKDTRDWWLNTLADEEDEDSPKLIADEKSLSRFIRDQVLPWFDARRRELALRPVIRKQALGESLDPSRLERLARYEVHLDRKLERMLTMLIRLKDLREQSPDRGSVS